MRRMDALSRRLTTELAERIASVAPGGVTVCATGCSIDVVRGELVLHGSQATVTLSHEDDRSLSEHVLDAATAALDGTQDAICRAIGQPWPLGADGRMAEPFCTIKGEALHMQFGDAEETVLELRSLSIPDLLEETRGA